MYPARKSAQSLQGCTCALHKAWSAQDRGGHQTKELLIKLTTPALLHQRRHRLQMPLESQGPVISWLHSHLPASAPQRHVMNTCWVCLGHTVPRPGRRLIRMRWVMPWMCQDFTGQKLADLTTNTFIKTILRCGRWFPFFFLNTENKSIDFKKQHTP